MLDRIFQMMNLKSEFHIQLQQRRWKEVLEFLKRLRPRNQVSISYIYIFLIAVRPAVAGFASLSAVKREFTGWPKNRILKPARKLSLVVTFVSSERARPDKIANLIKEVYLLNRCTACRFGVYYFISSEERAYWLA